VNCRPEVVVYSHIIATQVLNVEAWVVEAPVLGQLVESRLIN